MKKTEKEPRRVDSDDDILGDPFADAKKEDPDYVESLGVDPDNIEEEYVKMTPHLARQNELYAQANREYLHAERKLKKIAAQLWLEYLYDSDKKPTEHTLKAMVEVDVKFQAAKIACVEAEAKKQKLFGRVEAMRAKKEAVISIGAQLRAEYSGNPAAAERAIGRRDVKRSRGDD